MSTINQPKRGLRPALLLALVPILAAGCCFLVSRPASSATTIDAAETFHSAWEDRLEGFDRDSIEALAIETRGGSVELGLLLGSIHTSRDDNGRTFFEADLANIGDFPISNPRAILRLFDVDGRFVETVTLTGMKSALAPQELERISGEYVVRNTPPRIVEETITLFSENVFQFTTYSYEEMQTESKALFRVAELLPFISYEPTWSNPGSVWHSYKIQFRIDEILRD